MATEQSEGRVVRKRIPRERLERAGVPAPAVGGPGAFALMYLESNRG